MKNKLFIAAVILILAGLATWLILDGQKPEPVSAWIKFPGDSSVRVIGVTYGTNHILGSKLAQTTSRLPEWAQDILGTISGHRILAAQTFNTVTPQLAVWIEHQTNALSASSPIGGFEIFLADSNNFTSGDGTTTFGYSATFTPQIEQRAFRVFPRREREIGMDFFHIDTNGRGRFCTNISFPNPLFKSYPVWQAESLPTKKRAGDIEVTLLSVETGHDNSSNVTGSRDGSTKTSY